MIIFNILSKSFSHFSPSLVRILSISISSLITKKLYIVLSKSQLLIVCDSQVVFGDPVFKNVVNSDNLVDISVCPLHIKLLSLVKLDHILFFCFDWKRGVNPVTACKSVFAGEVWVSTCFKNYVPEWFSFSHNKIILSDFSRMSSSQFIESRPFPRLPLPAMHHKCGLQSSLPQNIHEPLPFPFRG